MRLYLDAESKNNIGYTPDWIQVGFDEDGKQYELTFDIRGDIDYNPSCLSCRCKGDLIPWVLFDLDNGDEIDLSELSEEEVESLYPTKKLAEIFEKGYDFLVGIYPVEDEDENNYVYDILSNCTGKIMLYVGGEIIEYSRKFEFDTECNI